MPGTLRGVALLALVAVQFMAGSSPARADSHTWQGLAVSSVRLNELGDVVENGPRTLTKDWSEALFSQPGTSWDGEVKVTTSRTGLTFFPQPTRVVAGTVPQYIWATRTNGMQPVQVNGQVTEDMGFSLRRTLSGGRRVDPGPATSRTLDVEFVAGRAYPSVQVSMNFSFPGPVSVGGVACTPTTPDPPTGQMNWFLRPAAAGDALRVSCTFSVTNSSALPASYVPSVFAVAQESREDMPQPLGATSGAITNDLGLIEVSVTPPTDTPPLQGTMRSLSTRGAFLQSQNVAVQPQTWTSLVSEELSKQTPGDSSGSGIQPLQPRWAFSVQAGPNPWPGRIDVTTTLPASELTSFPPVQPVPAGGAQRYSWSGTSFFNGSLSSTGSVHEDLGFVAERSLAEGRSVPGGASAPRRLDITVRTSAPMQRFNVFVGFHAFVPPGGALPPVTVSSVACPGSTVPMGSDGRSWQVEAPALGSVARFTCTFVATNSSPDDALYMPSVFVAATRSFTSAAPQLGATRLQRDVPSLGSVEFSVEPPAGTVVQGSISTRDARSVSLFLEDRLAPRPTRLEYTGPTSAIYPQAIPHLAARLTETRTGAALGGRTVRFEIGGVTVGTAVTDATGEARLAGPFLSSALPGVRSVRASFAGNAAHRLSDVTAELAIQRRASTIEHRSAPTQTFGFATGEARLLDTVTGAPLPGRPIVFRLDGVVLGTRVTGPDGVARFGPGAPGLPGTHTVDVTFAGDATREPASASGAVTIVNSIGKVTGAVAFQSGAEVELAAKSDDAGLKGGLIFRDGAAEHRAEIVGLGLSPDGMRAELAARGADGRRYRVSLVDGGEPAAGDELRLRIDGVEQDLGPITEGNVQIHQ